MISAEITVEGGCFEQEECDTCNQLPGRHEEFACYENGCDGTRTPKCFRILEWLRYNDDETNAFEPRFWKTVGGIVTLDDAS